MLRTAPLAVTLLVMLAAPTQAQKFLSVTGESTRTTIGAIAETAATPAAPEAETEAAEGAAAPAEGEAVAAADGAEAGDAEEGTAAAVPAPAGTAVADFIPAEPTGPSTPDFELDQGECNRGTIWDPETRACRSF